MRERLEQYAPYIAWFGLFLILVGLVLPLFISQATTQVPDWLSWAFVGIGFLFVLAWPVLRPADLKAAAGARQTRFGLNALLLVLSVIGGLVVINFLGTRMFAIWDLTSNQRFSISRQTVQVLDSLNEVGQPITLTAVLPSIDRQTTEDLEKLVDKYRVESGNIAFRQIDPQVDGLALMALAERIDMQDAPPSQVLVAEMGGRHEVVYSGFDEQAVTEAIVKVMREDKRRVAFTTGHDEYDPNGAGERGYFNVKQQLEREGYTIETINLTSVTQTLRADTFDAVVVAGPRRAFLPQEAESLASYLDDGGSVMIMIDPTASANLDALMVPWGLTLNDDIVIQQNMMGLSSSVLAQGNDYQFHSITRDLTNLNTIFPDTRSIQLGTPVTTSLQATALVQVGDNGEWGETDFDSLQSGNITNDVTDTQPPIVLSVAAEDTVVAGDGGTGVGRLVVFGTSSIASDSALQMFPLGTVANFDLFLNAVNWLSQEESLVSIRPTEPDDRPIQRPGSPLLLLLATAVLAPLAILGAGTWVYWRRR